MNRFTYQIKISGFNKTIIVYDRGVQIYSNISSTLSQSELVRIAKVSLRGDYGSEIDQMIEINPSVSTQTAINTSTTTTTTTSINVQNFNEEQLTPEEIKKKNYEEAKKNIQERKKENQQKIDKILNDPFAKQKEKNKIRKERIKKTKKKSDEEKAKARKDRSKVIFQAAKKSLTPILILLLTNELSKVIDRNNTIKKLVEDTNKIIEEANQSNDPTKLENAKLVRNGAIKVIQSNIDKIIKINDQLKRISIYINIFNTIVNVIGPIILTTPIPSPSIDIVTIPKETFRRKVYEPALKILNGLSAALPIITTCLQKLISILEDYRSQLLAINNILDNNLPPTPVNLGTDYGTYKGFKFALREENNPKFEVRGNKRHYAVAINKQNIDQLKSEPSFTLDPNDLIEQLKLVIDQQNLQG